MEFATRTPKQIPLWRNLHIMAVITKPQQVRRILLHLIKTGKAPPGLDTASFN